MAKSFKFDPNSFKALSRWLWWSTFWISLVNGLACLTKIQSEASETTITSLPHMFVIEDLVVDMTNFYNHYKSIEPWLKRKNPPSDPGKGILQSKKDKAKLDGIYECILCACCSTSCPSYWWNPDS